MLYSKILLKKIFCKVMKKKAKEIIIIMIHQTGKNRIRNRDMFLNNLNLYLLKNQLLKKNKSQSIQKNSKLNNIKKRKNLKKRTNKDKDKKNEKASRKKN